MIIYKFKDLRDEQTHSHLLQIVLEKTIWCARPESLNDKDEFAFRLDYTPSPRTPELLTEFVARRRTTNCRPPQESARLALANRRLEAIVSPHIERIVQESRSTIGVTSFSLVKDDPHLWEEYGGRGNGARVEIEIPERLVGERYHRVRYVPKKVFHVDRFLESALFPDKRFDTYRDILLTKTKWGWETEEEVRFVGRRQDVNFALDGRVREVAFGPCVPTSTLDRLVAAIASHCCANDIRITRA